MVIKLNKILSIPVTLIILLAMTVVPTVASSAQAINISSFAQDQSNDKLADVSTDNLVNNSITDSSGALIQSFQNITAKVNADNIKYAAEDKAVDDYVSGRTKNIKLLLILL
jgi:hypothetical protein